MAHMAGLFLSFFSKKDHGNSERGIITKRGTYFFAQFGDGQFGEQPRRVQVPDY